MDKQTLIYNLKNSVDENLVTDLIDYFVSIKEKFVVQDIESLGSLFTKYCETVFQILEFLRTRNVLSSDQIRINSIIDKLEQTPRNQLPESVRLLIPRVTKTIYDLRSKRGLVHKKDEIDPNMIDVKLGYQFSSWILSEFIRLYHIDDEEKIEKIINSLGNIDIPLIEKFEDGSVVFSSPLNYSEKILWILFGKYPNRLTMKEIDSILRPDYPQIITSNVRNIRKKDPPLIHQNNDGIVLTKVGIKYVSENLLGKITG